jgi:uncharacterized protein (DUF58 family)
MVAEFSDPLGVAKREHQLAKETEIIVHPRYENVLDRPLTRAFEDPPLRPPRSRPWPEGFEFYGMRHYVPGDDMRRVVWRVFARTGQLMVREFEQGISDRIAVVVDTDQSWHRNAAPSDTFETAIEVAASVGVKHIRDGYSVRLDCNYAPLGGPYRGANARLKYLDELARLHMSKEPYAAAIERLLTGRADAHIVLITSHLDATAAARANMLVNRGASLTFVAILWEESDPVSIQRAHEIGAQVVTLKPGAAQAGIFRSSLLTSGRANAGLSR